MTEIENEINRNLNSLYQGSINEALKEMIDEWNAEDFYDLEFSPEQLDPDMIIFNTDEI